MKKTLFLIIMGSLLTVAVATACNTGKGETLVEIDNTTIRAKDFENYYYAQNQIMLNVDREQVKELAADPSMKNHPTLNKSRFMDNLIATKLLVSKAENDPDISQEELRTISELSRLQAVANYYRFAKLKDEIAVTDEEIDQFYEQNREHFRGVAITDEVMERIRQQIFMQKFERASSEFVMGLMAESKVSREGFREYLKKQAEKGYEHHMEAPEGAPMNQQQQQQQQMMGAPPVE